MLVRRHTAVETVSEAGQRSVVPELVPGPQRGRQLPVHHVYLHTCRMGRFLQRTLNIYE